MRTVVGVFGSLAQAERTARDLETMGIPNADISIVAGNDANRHKEYLEKAKLASTSAGSAAATGASVGGGVGLVAGLIALAIPGVGPIVAGGAIATILTGLGIGAAGGGLIAALADMGISHEEAPVYEEAVRRGAVMLAAHVSDALESDALAHMERHGARDLRDEIDTWKTAAWQGPHVDPHPYVYDGTVRSHEIPEETRDRREPAEKPGHVSPGD
jgi:uncharacterized membrane protein